jgi:iron(III) transport system ATP-binding protein
MSVAASQGSLANVSDLVRLRLVDVTKRFGDVDALRGVSLDIPAGSFSALLGPSGCGKTTLLRLVAGFDTPDSGSIEIDAVSMAAGGHFVPPEDRNVGIVPQEGALFPHLNVEDNIGFGLPRSERRGARVGELLELVGMGDLRRRRPHELSGGQQQRVALARCLATRPSIVLLDEPFAALDATLREEVRAETKRVLREIGATTVLVTHDQDEALSMADRVGLMRNGTLVQFASPAQLYADPLDAWAAGFVGEANLIPVRSLASDASSPEATTALGAVRVRADRRQANIRTNGTQPVVALVRPEQVKLNHPTDADVSVDSVKGQITEVVFHGHDHLVTIKVESDPTLPPIIARAPAHAEPIVGETVALSLHGSAVLFSG